MKHWKPGYSAYETAHVWLKEDGFPKEIRDLFKVSSCGKWNNPPTPGKTARLEYQKKMLGLIGEHPTTIRYQLLHRTASAVIELDGSTPDTR